MSIKSPTCINNGKCVHCGCKTPEKFYEDRGCSNKEFPCYGDMLSQKEWSDYKLKNGIHI